jgi:hypothetical protein
MDRNRLIPTAQWLSVPCFLAMLGLLSGCVTTSIVPEMAWVRTDGRKIADDPALLQQGKSDIAACDANLDSGTPTASARGCMAQKGYVLVRRDQAEDVRAAVNYAFIDHFQEVARAHFIVRRLERRYGKDTVRAAYDRLSSQASAAA